MKCIVLCAGYNENEYPKALNIINGKCNLDNIIDNINCISEIDTIYVVTNGKNYNKFLDWEKNYRSDKVKIINDNTTSPNAKLGAIGDIKYTLNYENIDDDLFIVAGDAVYDFSFKELYTEYLNKKSAVVAVKKFNDEIDLRQYGIINFDNNNKVTYMKEKVTEPIGIYMALALYIFPKETIRIFDYYLSEGNRTTSPGYFLEYLYNTMPVFAYQIKGNYEVIK